MALRGFTVALAGLLFVVGCDSNERGDLVGREGGTVVSADGRLAIEIPADALDQEVEVSIVEVDGGPDGAMRVYEVEPRLTQLRYPATITFELEPSEALSLRGEEGSVPAVEMVIEHSEGWNGLADQTVDLEDGFAEASLMYFASIAVVGG